MRRALSLLVFLASALAADVALAKCDPALGWPAGKACTDAEKVGVRIDGIDRSLQEAVDSNALVDAASGLTTWEAVKACLESEVTRECQARGEIQLPAGQNVVAVKTANEGFDVNGRDWKRLACDLGAKFLPVDDGTDDASTVKLDLSAFIHDWEFELGGCSFDAPPNDVEIPLEIAGPAATAGRLRIKSVHVGQESNPTGTGLRFSAGAFSVSIEDSMIETNLAQVATSFYPLIVFDGAFTTYGGAAGQGGWLDIQRTKLQANTFGACLDNRIVSAGHAWNLVFTNNLISCDQGFLLGGIPAVHANGGLFVARSVGNALFRYFGTGTLASGAQRSISGQFTLVASGAGAKFDALWSAEGTSSSVRGPRSVNARVTTFGNGTLRALGTLCNACTADLEQLAVEITAPTSNPLPFADGGPFSHFYDSKLASEAKAHGFIAAQGNAPVYYSDGVPSSARTMFAVTVLDLANAGVKTIATSPAPHTVKRALCVTEDNTGSAIVKLRKKGGADVTPASIACGFRKTDAVATDCTPGPCAAGAPQTATLSSTADFKGLRCVADANTYFEISAGGFFSINTGPNIDAALTTGVSGTSISWTPIANVTTDLACTYNTVPAWITQSGANTFAEGEALELVGVSGFNGAGEGRTRVWVESDAQ